MSLTVALVVMIASPAGSAPESGWIRLAHLSPDTPSVDVYLYPFGEPTAEIVLEHVGYGGVSPYQRLDAARYTVAMRGEGADPDSPPVISINVNVESGKAYTVAGMGRTASLTIQVLQDSLSAPAGQASVRVIQASLQTPVVDVSADETPLAADLRFPEFTPYASVDPGAATVSAAGDTATASLQVNFADTSTHTVAVLDRESGALRLMDLTDGSGTAGAPAGGVNTGLGGTAPGGAVDDPPLWVRAAWLLLLAAAIAGVVTIARRRRTAVVRST